VEFLVFKNVCRGTSKIVAVYWKVKKDQGATWLAQAVSLKDPYLFSMENCLMIGKSTCWQFLASKMYSKW